MLSAVIIFLPGTGGNFLYRTLTLSEKTAFGDNISGLNYFRHVDSETRLLAYNTWSNKDWKKEESKFGLAYKSGLLDFYNYETAQHKIIDPWHPAEFYAHDQHSVCWNTGAWPNYIFIQPDEKHKSFLLRNQATKRYRLDWDTEINCMQQLRTKYESSSIDIAFDDFFNKQQFLNSIQRIDQILGLDLNFNFVEIMWQNWYDESQHIWKK